jgi:membrane peptidoglycan carboxypeptidase
MKYSVGITNSKKRTPTRKTKYRSSSPRKRSVHKNIKAFTANLSKKNGKKTSSRKSARGGKKQTEFRKKLNKVLYIGAGVVFFIGCVGLIVVGIYLKNLQNSLPDPDELVDRSSDQSTQIFDRNGELLYTVYADQNREFVPLDEIPEHTKWALLAAEDIDFYQHKGIDYAGILRSAIRIVFSGEIQGGGSTLSQQLVKNTLLKDILGDEAYAQKYSRKVKEILITMQMEQKFTKDEILQMYMNEVALGGVTYGFQAAANSYFGKDVQDLTLAESALLVGIIPSPGVRSPLYGTNPDSAKTYQEIVLNLMLKNKDKTGVTAEEIEAAKAEELEYKTTRINIKAPHFVFYVKQLLEEEFGTERVERGGLKVTTTLDYSVQEIAEEETIKGVDRSKGVNVNNGSLVAMDPNTGEILAMVGSVDYFNNDDPRVDGNVNIALSERQMGSSIKPFVYLTAFNQGYGPWLETPDLEDMKFGNYDPVNWDHKYMGLMTARKALVLSRNVPAVYTLQLAGIDPFIQMMQKLGVTTLNDKAAYGLSLALGSGEEKLLEHTSAFTVLATGGVKHDTTAILKVEDSSGEVLMEAEEDSGKRVVDEKEAYLVNWITCDLGNIGDRGSSRYYVVNGKKVCGKTGTTNGPKDLITVLYHKNLVVSVWNGNNNGEEMPRAWASTVPLPTAHSFMSRVSDLYKPETYSRPSGVLSTSVCTDTGATPKDGIDCEKESSIYISGRSPQLDKREIVVVCSENGLVATNVTAAEKYGLTEERVLLSNTLQNSYQQAAYEKYLKNMEDSIYLTSMPESGTCPLPLGPDNAPVVDVESPTSSASVSRGTNVEISGQVSYLESITTFTVQFDGSNISGAELKADGTFTVNYFIPVATTLGNHTITVNATDNYGKSDSKSIVINVTNAASTTVSIASPTNGDTVSFPESLIASVSGTVQSVSFKVVKVGGGYSQTFTDSDGTNGWSYSWNDNSGGNGDYTISVSALKDGNTITGNSVTVHY